MPNRLVPGRIPDPRRAHGAWVYLFAAVGAGAWVGGGDGVLRALCAGTAVVGAFLVAASIASGWRRNLRVLALGVALGAGGVGLALLLGAPRDFVGYSLAALVPVSGAALAAARHGFLSRGALACGVLTLALAGPTAARAGGATHAQSLLLVALLAPFFVFRILRITARLDEHHGRAELRRIGLREAAWTAVWTLGATTAIGQLT